jgi:hypothetical protein
MTMRRCTWVLLATAGVASALPGCGGSSPQEEIGVVSSAFTIDYTHLPNDSAITIHTAADVQSKRAAMIQYLWGSGGIPTTTVTNAGAIPAAEIDPSIINSFTNLGSSSKLVVSMELGQTSYGYLFRPAGPNGSAVIVHGGHGCGLNAPEGDFQPDGTPGLTATTKALLADGYTVVDLFMPHYAQGVDCVGHSGELDLVPATGKPLKFFLEPVARVINYLQSATPAIQTFAMTGWSGGGWTTTVYAAIDPRVKVSIPVAGTMPIYLSPQNAFGGDFEQLLPEFYSQWGYPDLYVMGSFGTGPTDHRRQVQVLNRNDNCCFTGNLPPYWVDSQWQQHVRAYEAQVQHTLTAIGAQDFFRLEIDDGSVVHQISRSTIVNTILLEIDGGRRRVGAATRSNAFIRGLGGSLWHYSFSGGWEDTTFFVVGVPSVIEEATLNGLDVFYRETGNVLTHAWKSGSTWTSESIGATLIADPVAVSSQAGRWDVIGVVPGYAIKHWWRQGAGSIMSETVNAGPLAVGTPAVVSRGQGALDVAVRGLDRGVYHYQLPAGGTWGGGEQVFGIILDTPAIAARTDYPSVRIYVRSPNNYLYEATKSAGGPWANTNLSRTVGQGSTAFVGSPSASVNMTGLWDVRVDMRTQAGALATYELPQWSWLFGADGGKTEASPTSVPGGEWARGTDGTLYMFDGAWHLAPNGLME